MNKILFTLIFTSILAIIRSTKYISYFHRLVDAKGLKNADVNNYTRCTGG